MDTISSSSEESAEDTREGLNVGLSWLEGTELGDGHTGVSGTGIHSCIMPYEALSKMV